MTTPFVSILMVARNAAAYIDVALASAREQSMADIEIVVVDDGSTDGTAGIARSHAQHDNRVRLFAGPCKGLSAVRNASLDAARGRFAIILDSDDVLHPQHVEWLVNGQIAAGVEICATNMVEFRDRTPTTLAVRPFTQDVQWQNARSVEAEQFVAQGMIGGAGLSLGYLKPSFDMEFLRFKGLRYDERLRIGEDFDLVLRAMLGGARYRYLPHATYYYRKHTASISHRLARADLEALRETTQAYECGTDHPLALQMWRRLRNLEGAVRHIDAITAIKAGQLLRAWRLIADHAEARRLMRSSLFEAVAKRAGVPMRQDQAWATISLQQGAPTERVRAITQSLQAATLLHA